jgi:hypothetical protein
LFSLAAIYPGHAAQISFVEGTGAVLQKGLFYAWDHWAAFQRFWNVVNGISHAIFILPAVGATVVAFGRFAALRSLIAILKRAFPPQIRPSKPVNSA